MSRSQVRRAVAALPLALAVGLLTACGGSDDAGTAAADTSPSATTSSSSPTSSAPADTSTSAGAAPAVQTLAVTGVDFRFELPSTNLTAGQYEVTFTNKGRATHDVVVEKDGADVAGSDRIPPGQSTTFTVTLEPGSYVFYCSVGNHRAMGMAVDVTVS